MLEFYLWITPKLCFSEEFFEIQTRMVVARGRRNNSPLNFIEQKIGPIIAIF